jgi:GT2 family glycosyltransferase
MTYGAWVPPAERDEDAAHLPGHNAFFRRDRLLEFGEELDLLLVSDINLHRRLRMAGERLLFDPAVKFEHINPTGLGSLAREYFLWHRLYGWSRARVFRWPARRRLLYVVLAPLIPFYFLVRLYRELRRFRPDLLGRFWRGVPLIWMEWGPSWCAGKAGMA